jgi:hypothetical protein
VMTVASSELLVRPPSVNCRKKRSNISFHALQKASNRPQGTYYLNKTT